MQIALPTPTTVAIIPARGGSKGIPGKNLKSVGGLPLVVRSIRSAQESGVSVVVVTTDDDAIARVAASAGAKVVLRPAELATDESSSESAILHALSVLDTENLHPEIVVFLQATSPFIESQALQDAIARVQDGSVDVVFSAFRTYAFLWSVDEYGRASGVNHDDSYRPRRQDRDPHFQETGAFYVMRRDGFESAGFRFFGRVGVQEVSELFAIDVDEPEDLELARAMEPRFEPRSKFTGLSRVKALVMDFDGVHTPNTAIVDQHGIESVIVSRSDGMGLEIAGQLGLAMLILSKERNPVVMARAKKLQIEVLAGVDRKADALRGWADSRGVELSDIAYLGNDVNDLECLEAVGWPIVVADAHSSIRSAARVVLENRGGHGAVREICDAIVRSRTEDVQA